MHKTTVMLPNDVKMSLQELALGRGISLSAVIREALEQYLPLYPFPKSIGMISDESFDASKDEEYLAEHWSQSLLEDMGSTSNPKGTSSD